MKIYQVIFDESTLDGRYYSNITHGYYKTRKRAEEEVEKMEGGEPPYDYRFFDDIKIVEHEVEE